MCIYKWPDFTSWARIYIHYNKNILFYEHTNIFIIVIPYLTNDTFYRYFFDDKIRRLNFFLVTLVVCQRDRDPCWTPFIFFPTFELRNTCIDRSHRLAPFRLNGSFQGRLNLQTRKRTYFVYKPIIKSESETLVTVPDRWICTSD